ncbi:uncharacterized protein LOC118215335 [Anguilla anguilla]|uniref:uncharacterized protein LOC118215335 n=1 Tax=Anguilla anguilla TaxID=7936 RepID=UPI0015B07C86|nr:uncharacterized protein LOC118215335 [Anguilla anguilla]XP_035251911.1 uncharacterized protein LOC118215335 [Anguilla anguilla]
MAEASGNSLHSEYIRDVSGDKLKKAEEARDAAVQILTDALEKGLYGDPVSFHYTCSKPIDSYKFFCIPTQAFLRDLLHTMQKVDFKEDQNPDPEESETVAYVYTNAFTVYLCEKFWGAPDHLCFDSKPGTLIHEVSHLLGTDDVVYERMEVELYEDHGTLMGRSQSILGEDEKLHYREDVTQINANSLEYEFEMVLNHKGGYMEGRYTCCGETKEHSVCKSQTTGHEVEMVCNHKEDYREGRYTCCGKTEKNSFCSRKSPGREVEMVRKHEGDYVEGWYPCCGQTKEHPLCRNQSTGHYDLHKRFPYRKAEMERRLCGHNSSQRSGEAPPAGVLKYAKIKNHACRVTYA